MQLSISDQRTIANIMDDTQRWLHSVDGIVIATTVKRKRYTWVSLLAYINVIVMF